MNKCFKYFSSKYGKFFIAASIIGLPTVAEHAFAVQHTLSQIEQQKKITVSGKVLDTNNEAIIGATILEKGSGNGTVTNMNGEFSLDVAPNAILEVSYIGYTTTTVKVPRGANRVMSIKLQEDNKILDEVIVVGYGTTSTRKNSTAVSVVDNTKIKEVPFSDMGSSLQGRVAGVIVQQGSAEPGQNGASVSIRGNGAPLYVIDGFVSTSAQFMQLNKNDIESLTVLKDAASTTVYGMNAGNGVVVVKTKQGSVGKLGVSYQGNFAFNSPSYPAERMDAYEYATAINKLYQGLGYGINSFKTPEEMAEIAANVGSYTNWEKELLKNHAAQSEHTLSVTGGNEKVKMFSSLNYLTQDGIIKGDALQYHRYNYRINASGNFEEIGLTVGMGVNGTLTDEDYPAASAYTIYSRLKDRNPFEIAYNPDGTISNQFDNPALVIESPGYYKLRTVYNQLTMNVNWNIPWVKGLSVGFDGNYNITSKDEADWIETAPYYDADGNVTYPNPSDISLTRSYYQNHRYDINFKVDYKNTFAEKHNVAATFVHNRQYYHGNALSAYANTFYTNVIHQLQKGDAESVTASNSESEQASLGYVGRLHYDFNNRYMIEFAGRYDGSDCFPKNKRFGFFPSVTAGWTISDEGFFDFLKRNKILDYLKIRASYGELGINGASHDAYAYLQTYNYNSSAYVIGGKLVNSVTPGVTPSENLTWYTRRKTDVGIDFATLNNKLEGAVDWFYESTKGYLASPNYEYTDPLGYSLPQIVSDAEDRNEGLDGYLKYKDKAGTLEYSVGANFTWYHAIAAKTNEDKVTLSNPYTRTQGYLYNYLGTGYVGSQIYQTAEEILNNPKREKSRDLRPGDLWYEDVNGDGKIDGQDQRKYGHSKNPTFVYGFDISLAWKGFSLLANIQGTGRRQIYMSNIAQGQEGERRLDFAYQLDTWSPENTNSSFPRPGNLSLNENNNYASSDFWARDAQYIRLKSLTIAYDFKHALLKKENWVKELSVFASGVNLFAIGPSVKYADPEASNFDGYAYPMMRTISFGLQLGF